MELEGEDVSSGTGLHGEEPTHPKEKSRLVTWSLFTLPTAYTAFLGARRESTVSVDPAADLKGILRMPS